MDISAGLDLLDSTTVALGSGASYTGQWMDAKQYNRICGSAYIQTTGGNLLIDQSPDATNPDFTTTTAIAAATPVGFSIARDLPWVRLRYTQGAGASGNVRLFMFGSTT